MEQSYKARFFDGKSSQPRTVDVSMTPTGLSVTYTDDIKGYIHYQWAQKDIRVTEFSSSILTLQHGEEFPYQQLEITDREFLQMYRNVAGASWFSGISMPGKGRAILVILIGVIAFIWLAYAFLLPLLANVIAQRVPKSYEIDLGKQLYESVLQGEEIDTAKTEQINLFFQQLHIESDYPIRITVVKSDIANAFALPGGGIVVYDKILEGMNDESELAALLAHEYSHVELKHATRNIIRSLSSYLFLSMMIGDMSGATAVILQNADNIRSLSYSRSLESEADQNGLVILKDNHISSEGMTNLFQLLKKENHIEMIEILSTHPDLEHRIENVKEFAKENPYDIEKNDSLHYYFEGVKND